MLRKTIFLLALLLLQLLPARAYVRLDYSPLFIRSGYEGRFVNGYYERLDFRNANYFGITGSMACSRNTSASIGVGLTRAGFQKETQGFFPATNQYGLAVVTQRNDYWTFPVSFFFSFSTRSANTSGIRLSYVPMVLGATHRTISLAGGAEQSDFASTYSDDSQPFRHSLLLYVSNIVGNRNRTLFFGIDPFIGIGSSFFKSDGVKLNTMTYGISCSVQFKLPHISIERRPDPDKQRQQQAIRQKQKEIEQQLKNKPKQQ